MGFGKNAAWTAGYIAMAGCVVIGIVTTLIATEPEKSDVASAEHAAHARDNAGDAGRAHRLHGVRGISRRATSRSRCSIFVVLFKFTDALAGAMTAPFVIKLGFSRDEYAAIVKGVGLAATLLGGFAGGFVARAYPLSTSLWIGGILQALANLAFSWQATVGADIAALTFAITVENFTSAIGTVIFVAYLSALCNNPLHTATQYALLTALAAVGRTYLSLGRRLYRGRRPAGPGSSRSAPPRDFRACCLLAWLQRRGHFRHARRAPWLKRTPSSERRALRIAADSVPSSR